LCTTASLFQRIYALKKRAYFEPGGVRGSRKNMIFLLKFWPLQKSLFFGGIFGGFWAFFSQFLVIVPFFAQKILENSTFLDLVRGIFPGGGLAK
jgi:hypothetical protein